MLITYKDVQRQLGLKSRESVAELVRKGKLTKHKVAITGAPKSARFDSDEVDQLEAEWKAAATPTAVKRPRRSTPVRRTPISRRLKGTIEFA